MRMESEYGAMYCGESKGYALRSAVAVTNFDACKKCEVTKQFPNWLAPP